ncbi:MAG: DUF2207 domain-containing protein [bacterium]|nr:DUF2207 domain-containing protein [bacterium]
MKKITQILLVFLLLFVPIIVFSQTDDYSFDYSEEIDSFEVFVTINEDATVNVIESILYNFNDLERHGIYRNIPYSYERDGYNYKLRLNVVSVTDEDGNDVPYTTSKSFGEYEVKIGDADVYVTGLKEYNIEYKVERAINYFDDYDEFYWNATGTEWAVPINYASANVILAGNASASDIQQACYTGSYGAEEQYCTIYYEDNVADFVSDYELESYEGLTIILGWPKGIVTPPDSMQQLKWFLADNWALFFPVVVFFVLFFIWYTRGQDPKTHQALIPFYEPPFKMIVGELGTVIDEKVDTKDISATIIQLAVKGFLKIKETDVKKIFSKSKDYELIKLMEKNNTFTDFETKVFEGIFGTNDSVKVSALKNKFYTNLPKIKKSMYSMVIGNGYFPTSPDKVRATYAVVFILVTIAGGFILSGIAGSINILAGISVVVSGVIGLVFSRYMPRKTKKGAEAHQHILGFKWFLSVTEKDRIKFHNSPTKSPKMFEEFLPYAMVLGVENEWADQFKDIYISDPEWYEGGAGNVLGAVYLANSLGSMSTNVNSAMVSRPSSAGGGTSGFSSGGGFSGGGFGGGGGGSW